MKTLILLLCLCTLLLAQNPTVTATRVIRGTGAPPASRCDQSGDVSNVYVRFDSNSTASPLSICTQTSMGVYGWVLSGTGGAAGSVPWSGVTAGTNAGQALLVGNGSTFGATGTGTITATAVPFSGVTSATSTNDYVLGAGGSLVTTSTGINETNAVRAGTSPPSSSLRLITSYRPPM